eukprot:TRINITY_DN1353_c0_g2_i2.p4 TRINITY_DN1353_c0_g2~~TRINITY_DN1353_c0_g2_i2.p4  ORF type:complete len:131 (-),score=4.08 TRINITY_DN1353_c0_g2_i2:212-604(-)
MEELFLGGDGKCTVRYRNKLLPLYEFLGIQHASIYITCRGVFMAGCCNNVINTLHYIIWFQSGKVYPWVVFWLKREICQLTRIIGVFSRTGVNLHIQQEGEFDILSPFVKIDVKIDKERKVFGLGEDCIL